MSTTLHNGVFVGPRPQHHLTGKRSTDDFSKSSMQCSQLRRLRLISDGYFEIGTVIRRRFFLELLVNRYHWNYWLTRHHISVSKSWLQHGERDVFLPGCLSGFIITVFSIVCGLKVAWKSRVYWLKCSIGLWEVFTTHVVSWWEQYFMKVVSEGNERTRCDWIEYRKK